MKRTLALVAGAVLVLVAPDLPADTGDGASDFTRDIEPLLARHCLRCHGVKKQEGGLRLDHRGEALLGGDSGRVIVPGSAASSRLIALIGGDDPELVMPPSGRRLSEEEVELFRRWIEGGALWPESASPPPPLESDHWAYASIRRPPLPAVEDAAWARNPIDCFVLARLEAAGITPSAEADRYTLSRRLSSDLLGLPPPPEEVDEFLADPSPDAYERLVERLLASPHFGERWGRHWLDKARYADSDGYEKDNPRPDAWRYRDWVIDAIDSDLPFDRFTIEQLAGDLLPQATALQRLATAFHRQTLTNTEGGVDQEQFRVEAVVDRTNTTAAVWLGLTAGCAQCHSHKYDQLSQREYYRLFAFFQNGEESRFDVPISDAALAIYEEEKDAHERRRADLEEALALRRGELLEELPERESALRAAVAEKWERLARHHLLEVVRIESESGAHFRALEDGSQLAGGASPERDTYTILARTSARGITGLRLEALADPALPASGPGRAPNGNFVLNELEVRAAVSSFSGGVEEPAAGEAVALASAEAVYSQDGFPVAGAIDGKAETGWALGGRTGRSHHALFRTLTPLNPEGRTLELRLTLRQSHGGGHTLGRFRFLARTGDDDELELGERLHEVLALEPAGRSPRDRDELIDYFAARDPAARELAAKLAEHAKNAPKPPLVSARVLALNPKPRPTRVLLRGDFLQPGEEVEPGTPAVLHRFRPRQEGLLPDRLDLAKWIVDAENPLTPRVIANQLWDHLFGQGLVRTINDFGTRGEKPSHPELLDWLASELVSSGWSRKAMIRLMVSSATYRQSSARRVELEERDPENQTLSRQNRFRIEAEAVRDHHLAASGLLVPRIGGPSVFPPMPAEIAKLSYSNNFTWTASEGADRYRRGMYTFFKRTAPHPTLIAFDCPDANTACLKRASSNTPLQALALLNNEVFVETSRALARRVMSAAFSSDEARLARAFRLCVARPPAGHELEALRGLLEASREWYASRPAEAETMTGPGLPDGVAAAEAAAWTATVRIILNLDEFISRE
jgi:mono/diheme cytochrome c family protein